MNEFKNGIYDERYAAFARNKEKYKEIVSKICRLFDETARTKDISHISDYEEEYKKIDNIRTAETFKFDVIKSILLLEKEYGATTFFFEDCSSCTELVDHYKKCTFYIRRLEMPLAETLKEEALAYLSERKVSGIAILVILRNELFEHKGYLCEILYNHLSIDLNFEQKIKNLNYYLEYMDKTTYAMNMASLFLERREMKAAYECLMKIENPSSEVCALVKELEAFV